MVVYTYDTSIWEAEAGRIASLPKLHIKTLSRNEERGAERERKRRKRREAGKGRENGKEKIIER